MQTQRDMTIVGIKKIKSLKWLRLQINTFLTCL